MLSPTASMSLMVGRNMAYYRISKLNKSQIMNTIVCDSIGKDFY